MAEKETATATVQPSEGAGDTDNAPKRKRNRSPSGQTADSSGVLGGDDGDDFGPTSHTRIDNLGKAKPTRVLKDGDDDDDEKKTPKLFSQLTSALGKKESDMLSYNERSRIVVYSDGAKYQIGKKGKSLRVLAGPNPPASLSLDVQDARHRSPFTGTSAALNAPAAVVEANPALLREERDNLRTRLAELDEKLGDEDNDGEDDEE